MQKDGNKISRQADGETVRFGDGEGDRGDFVSVQPESTQIGGMMGSKIMLNVNPKGESLFNQRSKSLQELGGVNALQYKVDEDDVDYIGIDLN